MPGILQAANYDTGGQNVAYKVTSVNGTANSYRSDGVDLETTGDTTDTTGAGAGYDLGWTGYGVVNDNAQSEDESWNITGGVGATAPGGHAPDLELRRDRQHQRLARACA